MNDTQQREEQRVVKAAAAFQRFMDKAETKLLISLIPRAEPVETIETLLRAAFEAGAGHGTGDILGDVFEAMFKGMDKKRE